MLIENKKEYQTVILSVLIRGVERFRELRGRTKSDLTQSSESSFKSTFINLDLFSRVTDVPLLKELALPELVSPKGSTKKIGDNNKPMLANIINIASNLSSPKVETYFERNQSNKIVPLLSVVEKVNQIERGDLQAKYHATPLGVPATLGAILPKIFDKYGQDELSQHIDKFEKELNQSFESNEKEILDLSDFDCLVHHLSHLLNKYTWCIPGEIPDVSLYEQIKNTAAITSCLYLYYSNSGSFDAPGDGDKNIERYYLVTGDISGIQKYIFDIASIGVGGGVARRLRSRSLFVQLCSDVAAHLILRNLEIPIVIHTIMNSGGKFYLLLPNIQKVHETLENVQKNTDKWFISELNGELALNLAGISFNDDGFLVGSGFESGFSNILERVNTKLNERKKNKFGKALLGTNSWDEKAFKIDISYEGKDACHSCRKFPAEKQDLCRHCWIDREIGTILPDTKYLAFYESIIGKIPLLGCSVSLLNNLKPNLTNTKPYLVIKINDAYLQELSSIPAIVKYIAKNVAEPDNCEICREEQSKIATFECIAGRSGGDKLLGFLTADVDNLGSTFVFGLKSETTSIDSVSRISTLSRMLDLFFAGWIENLVKEEGTYYTIFSGGDDLFIAGPWDKIPELAERINNDFHRFTSNPSLTLSAGIAFTHHDMPISQAHYLAKQALELSKDKGRNRLTILGYTIKWSEWVMVKTEWQTLLPEIMDINSAFLYNLLQFFNMWQTYKDGDILGLRYHPLLAYNIARNIERRKTPKTYDFAYKLLKIRPNDDEQTWLLNNLGLITGLLIYSKRRGGK